MPHFHEPLSAGLKVAMCMYICMLYFLYLWGWGEDLLSVLCECMLSRYSFFSPFISQLSRSDVLAFHADKCLSVGCLSPLLQVCCPVMLNVCYKSSFCATSINKPVQKVGFQVLDLVYFSLLCMLTYFQCPWSLI